MLYWIGYYLYFILYLYFEARRYLQTQITDSKPSSQKWFGQNEFWCTLVRRLELYKPSPPGHRSLLPPPILELSTEFREIWQYSKKAPTTISWLKGPMSAFTQAIFVWTLWKLSRNFVYRSIRYVLKVNISGKLNWRETDSSQFYILDKYFQAWHSLEFVCHVLIWVCLIEEWKEGECIKLTDQIEIMICCTNAFLTRFRLRDNITQVNF